MGILIRLVLLALLVLGPLLSPAADNPDAGEPTQIVDALHEALIQFAIHDDSVTYASRFQQLDSAVRKSHDFPAIARLVGGRFWKKLGENQRSTFIDSFTRASIAAYASRFATADGVRFVRATMVENSGRRVRVRSELVNADANRIVFEYVLHTERGQWKIITILVDGVSDLALQRAELSEIYADSGFPGVMKNLEP